MPIPSVLSNYALEAIKPIRLLRGRLVDCRRLGRFAIPGIRVVFDPVPPLELGTPRLAQPHATTRHMTNNPRSTCGFALALMVWLNYDA